MGRFCSEMKTSAAASFGGKFVAFMTSLLLVFAGIAMAVSVVFFSLAVLDVRLQVIIISIILLVLVIPLFPRRRKR